MRDALMNMIVYQGDTEFASVSSSATCLNPRLPIGIAALDPRDDRRDAHGWQMCALLIDFFGSSERSKRRRCWSAAPLKTSACWAFQRRYRQLVGLLHLHRLR